VTIFCAEREEATKEEENEKTKGSKNPSFTLGFPCSHFVRTKMESQSPVLIFCERVVRSTHNLCVGNLVCIIDRRSDQVLDTLSMDRCDLRPIDRSIARVGSARVG
jgi:hypothetical protein